MHNMHNMHNMHKMYYVYLTHTYGLQSILTHKNRTCWTLKTALKQKKDIEHKIQSGLWTDVINVEVKE